MYGYLGGVANGGRNGERASVTLECRIASLCVGARNLCPNLTLDLLEPAVRERVLAEAISL